MTIPKKELPPIPEKTCFVVTAIGNPGSPERIHADKTLKHIIVPVCEELNYKVTRVDQESINGNITDSIINHLKTDDLVIADLTGHNPNAFYELGYRQALNLPLVPIIHKREQLPFDVITNRTLFFDMDVDEIDDYRKTLKDLILDFNEFVMPAQRSHKKTEFDIINQKLDDILKYAHDKEIIDKLDKILANTKPSTISNSMIDVEKTLKSAYNVTNRLNLTADDLLKSQARPSILSDTKE